MSKKDQPNLEAMRHTAAHLLAAAVKDLWPGTHNAIGPAIADGFYQDFDFGDRTISQEDFPKIEKRMRELLKNWGPFAERNVTAEEARQLFADNPYKLELIEDFAREGKKISVNNPGNFLDLCRGGHAKEPRQDLKYFKLLSLAGAYWRGDEKKKMLTRIYGTAFFLKEELDEHLKNLAEAKKRDHRKLGKELDLFTFSPLVGPGLPLFTPRGTTIRRELEKFLQSIQEPLGYQAVTIPHLARPELYKTSGHWDKFEADLFHVRGKHDEEFVMKPMNCPHHTQIYASRPRSYRELPLRFSEVTMVYRDEQAGELQGLSRVRSITQDDAHVFCQPDQVQAEMEKVLQIVERFYAAFSLELSYRLSLWDAAAPEKYLGAAQTWEKSQEALRQVLQSRGVNFTEAVGEAAFYGPKIDFMARDSLGRTWQMATTQLDFNMPGRFGLTYAGQDGHEETPVMIHRAIAGSYERFLAILLEHYAGALPLWLSPIQVTVLPIADEQTTYAKNIVAQLVTANIRTELDDRSESIGKKIRDAQTQKVPAMLIIGKKEVEAGTVALRLREKGDQGDQSISTTLTQLADQITNKL